MMQTMTRGTESSAATGYLLVAFELSQRWWKVGFTTGMVASEARPSLTVAAVLVGVFAIFHGHAHGTDLPAGQSGLAYSIGFVVATGLLHAAGIALGSIHKWAWGRSALRLAGTTVALAGLVFVWRVFA
jgi:urease accessory protein